MLLLDCVKLLGGPSLTAGLVQSCASQSCGRSAQKPDSVAPRAAPLLSQRSAAFSEAEKPRPSVSSKSAPDPGPTSAAQTSVMILGKTLVQQE